jgi:serine/threonine-protein kinase HipA
VKSFFGTNKLPVLDLDEQELIHLAEKLVHNGMTVAGVQKKMSLHLSKDPEYRLTIVDYPSGYILKPQTKEYPNLPEYEDLVMRMASSAGIRTVPHALMKNRDDFAYITARVDRKPVKGEMQMYAMEDFCQLSWRMTEDKYKGSYERCAGLIKKYAEHIGLDLAEFYLRVLFSFATGNSDMHLKNFSLREMTPGGRDFILSEAYDLLPVNIVLPADQDETALTVNGKKRNLRRKDFLILAEHCDLTRKTAEKMIARLVSREGAFRDEIRNSFLPEEKKEEMENFVAGRLQRLVKS